MNRSGYADGDCDNENWHQIMWRGAVKSAIRGKRGQAFLKELIAALDAMPEKLLITDTLINNDGEFCALGAVGAARNIEIKEVDSENVSNLSSIFGIAEALAREIMWLNDEGLVLDETMDVEKRRWVRMREWAVSQLAQKE